MVGNEASNFILNLNLFVLVFYIILGNSVLQRFIGIEVNVGNYYIQLSRNSFQELLKSIICTISALCVFGVFIKFEWVFFILLITYTFFFFLKKRSPYWDILSGDIRIRNRFTVPHDYTRAINALLCSGKLWHLCFNLYAISIHTTDLFSFMAKGG